MSASPVAAVTSNSLRRMVDPLNVDVGRMREHRPCQGPIAAKCPSTLIRFRARGRETERRRERTTGSVGKATARKELPDPAKKLPGRRHRALLGERAEGRRLALPPAVGHDAERFDEA